ncbi:MAG: hypothetical protein M1132_01480 [Chloroflexi bacterium]|nr:hypothetical protein [Chloroflexota bacterium]
MVRSISIGLESEVTLEADLITQQQVLQVHAVDSTYVTALGESAAFGRVLWAEAVRRRFPEAGEPITLSDGAAWIWNLPDEHFSGSRQVVDWYHAKQCLATAGVQWG